MDIVRLQILVRPSVSRNYIDLTVGGVDDRCRGFQRLEVWRRDPMLLDLSLDVYGSCSSSVISVVEVFRIVGDPGSRRRGRRLFALFL